MDCTMLQLLTPLTANFKLIQRINAKTISQKLHIVFYMGICVITIIE